MATGLEQISFEITKSVIGAVVKPALNIAFSGLKSLSAAALTSFGNRFESYILQQAEKHSCLSTIVFGHQRSLEELYIPLTVVATQSTDPKAKPEEITIAQFHTPLLPGRKRVLITDTAGMGKSTLSKFLFIQCLKSGYAIPIFQELRHLSERNTVSAVIQKQLNSVPIAGDEPRFTRKQIERMFNKGGLVFFFDGFDEIPFKERESVTRDLKEFIEKYPNNIFIITSRPENALLAFPTFTQFQIRPLQRDESFALIRKYDNNGQRSEQLISKLTGRDFQAVQQFLKNPLLTSLLYRSFEYKQNVPLKKHIFYRQVYDALFDWHDATKDGYNTREKRSGLDIDAFHRVLRVIGFVSVMKGEVEGDTDAVLEWIRKARAICSTTPFSESNFLEDLVRAVPIFVKEGDVYRWSHKSLAEYFAAQYICTDGKPQQGQVLGAFLSSGRTARFSNVLDQVYDVDSTAFRAHIVLPLARAFSEHWATSYRAIEAAVDASDVRLRREVTFGRNVVLMPIAMIHESRFEEEVLPQVRKFDSMTLEDANLAMFIHDHKTSQVLVIATGPLGVVVDILASKKDPLIQRFPSARVERVSAMYKFPTPKAPHFVCDDPSLDYNKPAFFSRFTASLLHYPFLHVVDSEKMLAFEATFHDVDHLSQLADELIQPIIGSQGK